MQKQVEAILAEAAAEGFDVGYELLGGTMWQMWVGAQGGGRDKDGVRLARKLVDDALRQKRAAVQPLPPPRPETRYTAPPEPEDIQHREPEDYLDHEENQQNEPE